MARRYRDSKTGRLVSASTYKRSKAHGGKRFKRESYKPKQKKSGKGHGTKKREYLIRASYEARRANHGRKIEILVSTTDPEVKTRSDLFRIIVAASHGEETPGSKVKAIAWGTKSPGPRRQYPESAKTFGFFLDESEFGDVRRLRRRNK